VSLVRRHGLGPRRNARLTDVWHLYLLPTAVRAATSTRPAARVPKYINDLGVSYGMMEHGCQSTCLAATDVDDPTDVTLAAYTDVQKIPDNLDSTVGAGALSKVQNALESLYIPGTWVTVGTPYRLIVRTSLGAFLSFECYSGVGLNAVPMIDGTNVTLSTTFGSLPPKVRADLQTAALLLRLDVSGFTGASTLRQILKGIGDQYAGTLFQIGGISI